MKNVSTIYLFSQFLLNFPSMPFSSDFRDKLIEQLKGTFGKYYDYHRCDIAANEVDYLNVEDPDVFPIVHGNLNIRGNRKYGEISLPKLKKGI
ncbi:hypothetical protein [Ruminococcus sp.]|uniref:hypothetical protein n=1 Tax=Ruminococcus sp. TaxID=41978 RepID=UPI0039953B66